MLDVLRFWVIIQIFALAALPLTWRLFAALPSRGYALAKPLGLLLVTYLLWLSASLGLLRNSNGGILASLLVVVAASLWLGRAGLRRSATGERPLWAWLRAHRRLIVVTELLFLATLFGWAIIRSYSPEITTAGGEKWMELTFLNGILRSERFPPLDPWLSGFGISYYYFGYVMLAVLTRLSGLASSVAFNVGLATWFALTATAAFGVAYDMAAALLATRPAREEAPARGHSFLSLIGGLLGALFVTLLGNLAGFLEAMQGVGVGSLAFWRWLDVKDLNCLGGAGDIEPLANCPQWVGLVPERFYWWWRASRVLTDRDLAGRSIEVIDEFPFFSFLLGDMHPHVLGLPFVLLAIGLALALLLGVNRRQRSDEAPAHSSWLREVFSAFPLGGTGFLLYALCLGGLSFLNTWDFPIYLFLVMLSLGAALAWRQRSLNWRIVAQAVAGAAALGVVGGLLYLPFYVGFQSQAGGVLPNFLWPTRLPQFFVMFGPLLIAVILLLVALTARRWRNLLAPWARAFVLAAGLPVIFLLGVLALGALTPNGQELVARLRELPVVQQAGIGSVGQLAAAVAQLRLSTPWTYLLLAALLAWTLALLARSSPASAPDDPPFPPRAPVVVFALLALLTALLLTFSVEFVYLRDTFGTRMNTVFKFYFQAWVLLGLVAAFAVVYLASYAPRALRWSGLTLVTLLVIAGLFYPVFATYTRAEKFRTTPTLDGTAYLVRQNPGDSAAAGWLRQHVSGVATVLEAYGGSYTYAGRISAQTGLPTLLGWDGHELQWRGNTLEQDKRRPIVERIYGASTGTELQGLLNQWGIDYVVVGEQERQTFHLTAQSEARLAQIMELVYDSNDVRIYRNRQADSNGLTW